MIRDWDLWPWTIAAGAGELPLAMKRIEWAFVRVQREIGLSLYSVMRAFTRVAAAFIKEHPE